MSAFTPAPPPSSTSVWWWWSQQAPSAVCLEPPGGVRRAVEPVGPDQDAPWAACPTQSLLGPGYRNQPSPPRASSGRGIGTSRHHPEPPRAQSVRVIKLFREAPGGRG
ncbi:unnamed protein product [Gadus morhua 'NCC']